MRLENILTRGYGQWIAEVLREGEVELKIYFHGQWMCLVSEDRVRLEKDQRHGQWM